MEDLEGLDEVPDARNVFLFGDVTEKRIRRITKKIIRLAEEGLDDDPIYLYVSTLGGGVEDALALYDVIKFVKPPVITLGFGKIMSAGCLILAAGEPGKRRIARNATVMYHGEWDDFAGGVKDFEARLAYVKQQERHFDQLCALECGKTIGDVLDLYASGVDRYLSAEEAVAFGFADKIVAAVGPRTRKAA